jgi:hypothetical protein
VGENQVEPGRLAYLRLPVLEGDQKERSESHDLPGGQKQHGIGGREHQDDGGNQQIEEKPVRPQRPGPGVILQIAGRIDRAQQGEQTCRQEKKGRKGVEVQDQPPAGNRPGQSPKGRATGGEFRHGRQYAQQGARHCAGTTQDACKPRPPTGQQGQQAAGGEKQQGAKQQRHNNSNSSAEGMPHRSISNSCRWRRRQA